MITFKKNFMIIKEFNPARVTQIINLNRIERIEFFFNALENRTFKIRILFNKDVIDLPLDENDYFTLTQRFGY